MTAPLCVLFEDAHCLAVCKPAGLLTQGIASGEPTLETAVRAYLEIPDATTAFLGTVHRLDRPVSGVVVWAKTVRSARRLSAQFAERAVEKEYWAIVEGECRQANADTSWEDWLLPPDALGISRIAEPGAPRARRALTVCRQRTAVALPPQTGWLVLRPETGRTHQLRVQTAVRGHPILGDATYGAVRGFPEGIALHARSLRFLHPTQRQEVVVVAPVPEAWNRVNIVLPQSDTDV